MKADKQDTASLPDNHKENQEVDRSRRSFSKLGVALPVMMTLANKSAWAQTSMCGGSGLAFQSFMNAGQVAISHHVVPDSETPNEAWKLPEYWGQFPPPLGLPAEYHNQDSRNILNGGDVEAYKLASVINNTVEPFPPVFLPGGEYYETNNIDAYQTFYGICASAEQPSSAITSFFQGLVGQNARWTN